MRIVLLGPPGAGKGSLAELLKDSLGLLHLSTGDLLREEMKNETEIGLKVKKIIENGELVPDEVVTGLIESQLLGTNGSKGYMLDGFPRTQQQAESLDKILTNINQPLEFVFYMEAATSMIIRRLSGRRVCRSCSRLFHMTNKPPKIEGICDYCNGELYQRADDNEETIRNRMDVYMNITKPIIEYYDQQDKLRRIDGDKETVDLKEDLLNIINEDG